MTRKGYVPSERITRHRGVDNLSLNWTRVAEFNPANLWQANGGPFRVQPFDGDLGALESKTFVDAFLVWRRIGGTAREKVLVSAIQITERLVFACPMDCRDPVALGAKMGQFSTLKCEANVLACRSAVLPPEVPTLLQCEVVYEAARAGELFEQRVSLGRHGKLISETTMKKHAQILLAPRQKG
jgi:hypothetical protein